MNKQTKILFGVSVLLGISLSMNIGFLYERPAMKSLAYAGIKGVQACLADYNKLIITTENCLNNIDTLLTLCKNN